MMTLSWRNPMVAVVVALIALILLAATITIVPDTEQAVVMRITRPVAVINPWRGDGVADSGAGLIARWPLVDHLVRLDKRLLTLDVADTPITAADGQQLKVAASARYRIVDPLRAARAAGSMKGVEDQLRPLIDTALRRDLGNHPFAALLSPTIGQFEVLSDIQRGGRAFGIRIVDLRITRTDMPEGAPLDAVLSRMKGGRTETLAMTRDNYARQAQAIRAEGDTKAAQIYASALNQDPQFYDFFRAMQSYRVTFGDGSTPAPSGKTTFVLSPADGYLKQFYSHGEPSQR